MTPNLGLAAMALLVIAAGPVLSTASAGDGALSRSGTYEGGQYTIEVPARWNGGLVLYAHGFGVTQSSPLASHLLDKGYALAASSFRDQGYRVDWFVDDMRALRELFIREVRRPRWTIIHGQSMGGHVAIASLELHPGLYQGALIECGVIDGVGLTDFYRAARAAAEYLSGINLFEAPDRETLVRRVNEQWLPLMGTPDAYTERGRRFDSVLKYLMGGDLPLRLQGMARYYRWYVLPEAGPDTRELSRAASTVHVRYRIDPGLGVDENELNAKVRRIVPPADARSRSVNPAFAELTGRITVPVLAIHETGDGRVPWSLQQAYAGGLWPPAQAICSYSVRCDGRATAPSMVRCANRHSMISSPGSSGGSSLTATMCFQPTWRRWACDGRPSGILTIRQDSERLPRDNRPHGAGPDGTL